MIRNDTVRLAKSLILRFGCLGSVVRATVNELCTVSGIGPAEASALKAVQAVAVRLIKSNLQDRPVLRDWASLAAYLNSVLSYETVEHVRVLFLNQQNFLLGEELHNRGTVNHVPVYPREIAKRALELNSSAVIVAHNHPGGSPRPSGDDVQMTVQIMGALSAVGIALHDHIVVGMGSMVSFRKLGVVPFAHLDPDAPYHQRHNAG